MNTRPPAPRPRGRGAEAEGGRRHTTLGIQETRSRGGRGRNVPAPIAMGDDKGQRYIFPHGPVGAGRLDAAPNRYATLQAIVPRRQSLEAKEPRPTADSRGRGPRPPTDLRVRRYPRPRARGSHAGGGAKTRPRTHNDLRRHPRPSPLGVRGGGRKA